MKVGVFDSGVGGLSVLHCAKKMLSQTDFVYYADEKNVPYGEKTPDEIRGFLKQIFHFMLDKDVDAIVIACNTATSTLTREYRAQFPVPIVGMEPAVKKAVDDYQKDGKKILVAATPVTIASNKLHHLMEQVDKRNNVDLIALPKLVRFAEQGNFTSKEVEDYLRNEFATYDLSAYGTIVLGCTHFNYFKEQFQNIFGEQIHFVDGNEGTIHQLIRVMAVQNPNCGHGKVEYYFSGARADEEGKEFISQCMEQLDEVYAIE